jgi:hypothetical protein
MIAKSRDSTKLKSKPSPKMIAKTKEIATSKSRHVSKLDPLSPFILKYLSTNILIN